MKRIAILGSTGSIGRNTLDVIRKFRNEFSVVGLSSNADSERLCRQVKEFHPEFVCINDEEEALRLKGRLNFNHTRILKGETGLLQMVDMEKLDLIVLAIAGSAALKPLLKAVNNKKRIALANKEALVMAGPIIMREARKNGAEIIPIDSEQSAIWQCLSGQDKHKLKNIYLTASGGPFIGKDRKYLKRISVADVLKHPRWKMGKKITVDSATLMNKGLEVLETMYLFGEPFRKIKVLIHPQAIIHSMVEFVDGVILAQLSATDMRIPIQYALTFPERLNNGLPSPDFLKIKSLDFFQPDLKKFPCLGLAYQAAKTGGTMPSVLNAANEVSVDHFLRKDLSFISIPYVVGKVLDVHENKPDPDLDDIMEADLWARREAYEIIKNLNGKLKM